MPRNARAIRFSQSVSILSALDIDILPINWFPSTTDMLGSLSCETLLWLYFLVATPLKLPRRYLCIYMSTNGYVLSLFLAVFLRFFPFGSPSFLVIVLHFDLSSALSAHLDIGIPASLRSMSIDSAHLMQGLPLGRPWYTQEDNNFLGILSQLILLTCPIHLNLRLAM